MIVGSSNGLVKFRRYLWSMNLSSPDISVPDIRHSRSNAKAFGIQVLVMGARSFSTGIECESTCRRDCGLPPLGDCGRGLAVLVVSAL
jgi:hypothetical protein